MAGVKPLKPSEVQEVKNNSIPDEIIEAVNQMIVLKWNGTHATFKQDDLIDKIMEITAHFSRSELFDKNYLDIEDVFRKEGWKVIHDKPGFNESYPSTYMFKKNE